MRYDLGHINPWWDDHFKTFAYEYLPHKDQNMVREWESQGYTSLHLNGAIHNLNDSAYAQRFFQQFPWTNQGAALFKMHTGDITPNHKDHYITYKKVFNITNPSNIWRAIVFMEDWKSGHYFEIDGKPLVQWKRGDYAIWNYDVPHMAFNMGIEPRYTIQITGIQS
jgi:hypothetical protein